MDRNKQLVTDSNSRSTTISATNNIINNNQFNRNNSSNKSSSNNSSSNNNLGSNNSSNNCNLNSRLKKLSPPKLILVPKQPIGKIMESCSPSLSSALISFISTEEIQSIIYYEKTNLLPACFVCRLVETEEELRTGFVRYLRFYEEK